MTTMLRRRSPEKSILEHFAKSERELPKFAYDVDRLLKEMPALTDSQLKQWNDSWNSLALHNRYDQRPLDVLYSIVSPPPES